MHGTCGETHCHLGDTLGIVQQGRETGEIQRARWRTRRSGTRVEYSKSDTRIRDTQGSPGTAGNSKTGRADIKTRATTGSATRTAPERQRQTRSQADGTRNHSASGDKRLRAGAGEHATKTSRCPGASSVNPKSARKAPSTTFVAYRCWREGSSRPLPRCEQQSPSACGGGRGLPCTRR